MKWAISLGLVLVGTLALDRWGASLSSAPARGEFVGATKPARRSPPPQDPSLKSANHLQARLSATVKGIQSELDPVQREERLQVLLDSISAADLEFVLNSLREENPATASRDLQARLLRRWASSDPAVAAAWIDQLPAGDLRTEALAGVAVEWANRDLAAAVEWARDLKDQGEQQSALMSAAYEAVRTTPDEALALACELPASGARDELITHAASEWATHSAEEATAWAKQITDDNLRQHTLAAIATAWSDTDPVSAANLALKSLNPDRTMEDAVIGIVQRWVQTQPEQAEAWVAQFPAGTLRDTAMENVLRLKPHEGAGIPQ